jgi:hypothetical protein
LQECARLGPAAPYFVAVATVVSIKQTAAVVPLGHSKRLHGPTACPVLVHCFGTHTLGARDTSGSSISHGQLGVQDAISLAHWHSVPQRGHHLLLSVHSAVGRCSGWVPPTAAVMITVTQHFFCSFSSRLDCVATTLPQCDTLHILPLQKHRDLLSVFTAAAGSLYSIFIDTLLCAAV